MLSEAKHLLPASGEGRFEINPRFFASLRMTFQHGFVEFVL